MDVLNYVLKRIVQMIPVFIIVTIIIFFMIRMIPGDPAAVMLGTKATPEAIENMREKMGLNDSYFTQFMVFLKGLVQFDLGTSIKYSSPVSQLVADKFLVTLSLTILSTIFTVIISFSLGYLGGMHKDKWQDQITRVISLFGLAAPTFWIGLLLLTVFAVNLNWFPVAGWGDTWIDHIRGLILPAITQALGVSAVCMRNLRNNVIEIKNSDYVEYAKSKGVTDQVIKRRHIIRNALIPTVTLLSLKIAYMLGGSIIIESVFSLPGLGALLVNSILARDYPVVQGVVIVFVVLVMFINLATDILYSILDPRVKLS
ncbi:MAG: ABC transporter permease [Eubacteriales bacterium]